MNGVTGQRRGWCPGLWTPMQSGDGLIVRLRVAAQGLKSAQLRAIAALARTYGNGQIELTRRANIQLRGVTAASLIPLRNELVRLGLGDASAEAESRIALLVDPLAGLDPECALLEPLATRVEQMLANLACRSSLSAKFGVVLDAGGGVMSQVRADIGVELRVQTPELARLCVGGAGDAWLELGVCRAAAAVNAISSLLRALAEFADAAGDGPVRMRDMVAARGIDAVRATIGALLIEDAGSPWAPKRAAASIGFQRGPRNWFGVGMPFGSADAEQWNALAELAETFGDAELRVASTRSVLLLGVKQADRLRLAEAARVHGFIVEARDPLLRVVACSGAPACSAAWNETRQLARALADQLSPLLARDATLHVSGCSKGCASNAVANVTIVHGTVGSKLGLNADVAHTSLSSPLSMETIRARLAAVVREDAQAVPSKR
jgi:precorrin-3B synthase